MLAHLHIGHHPTPLSGPESPLRGMAHRALVAAEIGVAAVVVVTAIDRLVVPALSSTSPADEPAVISAAATVSDIEVTASAHSTNVTYRDDIATGTTFVDVVGADGSIVAASELDAEGVLTFRDLPAGTYHLVFNHQFPITEDAETGVGLGGQHVLRSDPLTVETGDQVVVTLVDVGS